MFIVQLRCRNEQKNRKAAPEPEFITQHLAVPDPLYLTPKGSMNQILHGDSSGKEPLANIRWVQGRRVDGKNSGDRIDSRDRRVSPSRAIR